MTALRNKGKPVAMKHDEPEAIISPLAEYDALMQIVEQSAAQAELALAELRRSFDERLSVLQGQAATSHLRAAIQGCAKLDGKVKAASSY